MFVVMAAVFMSGCVEGPDTDPAFVGTWHWVNNVEWTYVINEDGTGQRGDEQHMQSFSWGTRNGVLVLNHGQGFRDDELVYTFAGDMLNLICDVGNFDYFRFAPDLDLVGTWVIFVDSFVELTKSEDGTGFFMPFLGEPYERVDFNWYIAGSLLIHRMGEGLQVKWTYTVIEDVLLLVDEAQEVHEFRKGSLYQNPAFVGTWAWDLDNEWEYFFGENANGERGREGYKTQIIWTTFNDILIIINLDTYAIEQWRFSISGNVLNLVNLQSQDVRYSYERRD